MTTAKHPKPTVGRIVHYHQRTPAGEIAPAIVTNVLDDTTVNLTVFGDHGNTQAQTSVALGTEPGTWAWPTRSE
jgi:hypothetical protein